MRGSYYQREWLLEDIEQIRRYFPGAELLETIDTPFDIKPLRSGGASEKRAGEWRLLSNEVTRVPQEGRAPLETTQKTALLVLRGCL